MNQFQRFPELLQQFAWFLPKDATQPYLPEKPHYQFGLENCYLYVMGIKFNGTLRYQHGQVCMPLLYKTFIKNERFFLEIEGKASYQILEIVLFPNSAKMKLQRESDNLEITLSGYKGNFAESIFSKNPLTGLKA